MSVDLTVEFAGRSLRNPVLLASGTCGYGEEMAPFVDLRELGGFVAKSLTLEPRQGNPPPRIAETSAGLLNAISLENVGVEAFLADKLPHVPEGAGGARTHYPQYQGIAGCACAAGSSRAGARRH